MGKDSVRALREAALLASLPEPQGVSALSGNDQPRVAFDWHRKLQTCHDVPREALVVGDDPLTGHKRVAIFGDYEMECLRTNPQWEGKTNWHYNQDGTPVGKIVPPEWRLVEAA